MSDDNGFDAQKVRQQTAAAVEELLNCAQLESGEILVVGCSTSEIQGANIGSSGSSDAAEAVLSALMAAANKRQVFLALQCCEHLNRALVVERKVMKEYHLQEVSVVPVAKAGGSLAAKGMKLFSQPVVVETIQAHAGIDIGSTLIGMHLRPVAVPVRLKTKYIGKAIIIAARTRPKLIGGGRAVYE
ncbi:MAG: TIGR01440 family protein [Pelosinus sp.]|nr:TIGR01440 family protein [Pelosinus sp.]